MAPIIEVSDETLETLNPKVYTLRKDLETKTKQIVDLDRSNWIVIPEEFTNGKYKASVDPARLTYNSAIGKVAENLGLTLQNTSKDSLGRDFIGNINWGKALRINLALGNKTPNLNEETDFLNLLYQGMQGKLNVYNKSGKQLDEEFLENVFYDVVGVKSPWRAEWLDADFKVKDKKLHINYNHVLDSNGNLIPNYSEILGKTTLMKDKTPGISLEDWLDNPTKQGLPAKKTKSGNLYYWHPRSDNNSVARFGADSDGAYLLCYRYPSYRNSILGVRAVRHE